MTGCLLDWLWSCLPACPADFSSPLFLAEIPKQLKTVGKKYQPPTVDAPGASSIGSTALVICIIMLVVIVLLDLTTIARDIKLLKRNLKRFRKRVNGSKQQWNGPLEQTVLVCKNVTILFSESSPKRSTRFYSVIESLTWSYPWEYIQYGLSCKNKYQQVTSLENDRSDLMQLIHQKDRCRRLCSL